MGRGKEGGRVVLVTWQSPHSASSAIIHFYRLRAPPGYHIAITIYPLLLASLPSNTTNTRGRAQTQH